MPQQILPNRELMVQRSFYQKARLMSEDWPNKWGWLLDEQSKTRDLIRKGRHLGKEKFEDHRVLTPVPKTSSGMYGWVASKPDFALEFHGVADRPVVKKMPKLFVLNTEKFHIKPKNVVN